MGADLTRAKLTWADLTAADLRGADLTRTNLSGVSLRLACLEETKLRGAWLGGTQVSKAFGAAIRVYVPGFPDLFNGTDLSGASCDSQTRLDFIGLGSRKEGMAQLTDVRWGGANLTVVNWATLETAANERPNRLTRQAQKQAFTSLVGRFQITNRLESWFFRKIYPSRILPYANRIDCRIDAARANRQLANVLRDQGMSRDADRFAYRAKVCGRTETLMDGALPQYLGSLLLDVISGYGFKPLRSIVTYLIVLGIFAAAYFGVTNFDVVPFLHTHATPLTWYEALVLSVSSFHGRGLFPTGLALGDPIAIIAAFEAVIGLLIEIIFIATFTQRYFNR